MRRQQRMSTMTTSHREDWKVDLCRAAAWKTKIERRANIWHQYANIFLDGKCREKFPFQCRINYRRLSSVYLFLLLAYSAEIIPGNGKEKPRRLSESTEFHVVEEDRQMREIYFFFLSLTLALAKATDTPTYKSNVIYCCRIRVWMKSCFFISWYN